MNKWKNFCERQSVLWAIGMAFVAGLFFALVTRGQFHHLAGVKANIATERQELAVRQQSPQAIAALTREVNQLETKVPDFDAHIPREANLADVLQKLAQFAQAHDLRSDSIQPGDPEYYAEVTALPISMKVKGNFPAIFALIKDIETMPRLTRLERFSVRHQQDLPDKEKNAETERPIVAELYFSVFCRSS